MLIPLSTMILPIKLNQVLYLLESLDGSSDSISLLLSTMCLMLIYLGSNLLFMKNQILASLVICLLQNGIMVLSFLKTIILILFVLLITYFHLGHFYIYVTYFFLLIINFLMSLFNYRFALAYEK